MGFQEFAINQVAMLHVQSLLNRTEEAAPELRSLIGRFRESSSKANYRAFLNDFDLIVSDEGFGNETIFSAETQRHLRRLKLFSQNLSNGIVSLSRFMVERLKVQQRDAGVRHDIIDSVFAVSNEDDVVRLLARVNALQSFVETEDGADLLTAYKRAANILKKEKWTGGVLSSPEEQGIPQTGEEDPLVLVDDPIVGEAVAEMAAGQSGADLPEEKALVFALEDAEPKASAAVEAEDFTAAMAALASLRRPIDEFFDRVTVNDPDPAKRERRLNLLMRFRDAVNRVADFSRIEG